MIALGNPANVEAMTGAQGVRGRSLWVDARRRLLMNKAAVVSLVLKVSFPENNTTQRAFPFMLLLSGVGSVAGLWLWFFQTPHSNGVIAGFVLGNMLSVALLVLPFAIATSRSACNCH